MKKILFILLTLVLFQQNAQAQNKSNGMAAAGAATAVVGLVAIGVTINLIEEMLEQEATQYILRNSVDQSQFRCKIISFNATKLADISNVSIVPFLIERPTGKSVLLMYVSKGWLTDYGVDYALVQFQEYSKDEWNKLVFHYFKAGGIVEIDDIKNVPCFLACDKKEFEANNPNFVMDAKGAMYQITGRLDISKFSFKDEKNNNSDAYYKYPVNGNFMDYFVMERTGGDEYLASVLDDNITIVYNEKALGIYNRSINRLSQLSTHVCDIIHDELNSQASGLTRLARIQHSNN